MVKPIASGSSVGVSIASSYDELFRAVATASDTSPHVLIEARIQGREASVPVCDDFRGEEYYAFPPIEIIPPAQSPFFDYGAKYSGETQEICPGRFSHAEIEMLQDAARRAHRALGARHYSRSDFIVTPRGVYILEINTLPGLAPECLLPKSLAAVGATLPEFLDHVISLAIEESR